MDFIHSWFFVPGNREKFIRKLSSISPDAIIYDLEDSVPQNEKELARNNLKLLKDLLHPEAQLFIRINSSHSEDYHKDLQAPFPQQLKGFILPKTESPEQIASLINPLSQIESQQSFPQQSLKIVALIETAKGLIHASSIAEAHSRVFALFFGAEDFALDCSITSPHDKTPISFQLARFQIKLAAQAAGIQCIDKVYTHLKNAEGFLSESKEAFELGFNGKALVHPNQIELLDTIFLPSEQEVQDSKALIQAAENHESGSGSFQFNGKMIDAPVLNRAHAVVQKWERAQMKLSKGIS